MSTEPHDDTTPDEPSQAADAVDKVSPDRATADKTPDKATEDKAPKERQPITTNRIVLWVIVAAIGLYFVVSGVYGILVK